MTLDQLIARGRLAYQAYLHAHGPDRPLGAESLFIVTVEDFVAFPRTCITALEGRASLYIFRGDGRGSLLLCRHETFP